MIGCTVNGWGGVKNAPVDIVLLVGPGGNHLPVIK